MKVIQPSYCTVKCNSKYVIVERKKDKTKHIFAKTKQKPKKVKRKKKKKMPY